MYYNVRNFSFTTVQVFKIKETQLLSYIFIQTDENKFQHHDPQKSHTISILRHCLTRLQSTHLYPTTVATGWKPGAA
jgi:hypothetical protein